jgi:ABC-2 type transport system permease protein
MLSWVIPFGFASFYPTTYFLRRAVFAPYVHLVPVVAVTFFLLALVVWNRGVRNYSSTGS